ncbi:MAG: RsmB/NOP family class I SAM-dependent RNA methyltransferase [Brevundimonas sp.]|uniref:RsmB/NOP family class I SAM-dependent RNA methyltransferase n=1 Tax=Brevundimonas sp. TaxID=1871086 RepID=UPI00248A0ACF|nr:RsmB/NOP family class I SAM-dependent RNA methyltransferase [Brevundimonas sp.]MDI1328525.1 RsmB/NOP family class I SAM-dependent RNA methyltransferase [Brevundimonas sp.]
MTPAARLASAASVLDSIAQGRAPADVVLKAWGAANRYAGSKDRRAVAERVYEVLRSRGRLVRAMGGREDGRALVIGSLAFLDGLTLEEIEALHAGDGYGPRPLSKQERARIEAGEGDLPDWAAAGLPEFVAEDLKTTFGDRWSEEAVALMARAPVDLRVNTARTTVEAARAELTAGGLTPRPTPWSAVGLRLPSEPAPNVQGLKAFNAGEVEIQDEGSQIVTWLAGSGLSFTPDSIVVDYCAGGGGKTLALAQMMSPSPLAGEGGGRRPTDEGSRSWSPVSSDSPADGGETPHPTRSAGHLLPQGEKGRGLIACDVVQKRLDNIRPRLERAGVAADLRLLGPNGGGVEEFNGKADLVFVDAPCSGSGAWRRRPEDAWRLKADEVERLHALQLRILAQAAQLVKPGGRLAYVTCSILTRENEAVADAFEAAHPGFRPVPATDLLAAKTLSDAARTGLGDKAKGGRIRLSPASTGTDGFFAALYERRA